MHNIIYSYLFVYSD